MLAITKAFENVFGFDITHIHCWFHWKMNMDKRLRSIPEKKWLALQRDLYQLQIAIDQDAANLWQNGKSIMVVWVLQW